MTPTPETMTEDAIVSVVTWILTAALGAIGARWTDRIRHALPLAALIVAVMIRAVWDFAAAEGGLTWATLARGLAAGAMAVAGHSGVREAIKGIVPEAPARG